MGRLGAPPLLAIALLASCATEPEQRPPPVSPSPGIVLQPAPYPAFETAQRDKALSFTQQERWADAAIAWEILMLLRPENAEYRDRLHDVQARIASGIEQHLSAATEARNRGDIPQAALAGLKALSLEPANPRAIAVVQELEHEAQRRKLDSRVARVTVAKDASPGRAASNAEHRDLEFAVLLYHQGDYAGSIKTLERYLRSTPKDDIARRYLQDAHMQVAQQRMDQGRSEEALSALENAKGAREQDSGELKAKIESVRKALAENYYQKGMKVYRSNLDLAITYWERSLQYDPTHPQAGIRLQQARQMQKNLKAIDGDSGQR
jgi:tetratricopeptide (TPR) repeat protein